MASRWWDLCNASALPWEDGERHRVLIINAIVAIFFSLSSLSGSRHGGRSMAIAGIELWLAGGKISVTRQHCREKTGSEIYLLSFFSLVKQAWREIYGYCRYELWLADSEISVTRQHCREKIESEISGELYTTNGRKIIRSRTVDTTSNVEIWISI